MPCIQWKTNAAISPSQEETLRAALGEAISLLPGKSESWLMLTFEPETRMAFRGKADEPVAFIAVDLYGGACGGGARDRPRSRLRALSSNGSVGLERREFLSQAWRTAAFRPGPAEGFCLNCVGGGVAALSGKQ